MGILHMYKAGGGSGETGPGFHGHDHAASLTKTEHPVRAGEKIHRSGNLVLVQKFHGLIQGEDVGGVQFAENAARRILGGDGFGGFQRFAHIRDIGRLGQGQLQIVVAGQPQAVTEAGNGSLRHAAVFRQAGDGQILGVMGVGKDVIRQPFPGAGKRMILLRNLFQYISGHANHLPCSRTAAPSIPARLPSSVFCTFTCRKDGMIFRYNVSLICSVT